MFGRKVPAGLVASSAPILETGKRRQHALLNRYPVIAGWYRLKSWQQSLSSIGAHAWQCGETASIGSDLKALHLWSKRGESLAQHA